MVHQMDESPGIPAQPEELCPGLTFEWLFDGRGFAFCAKNSSRLVVDTWYDKMVANAATWPANQAMFVLNDFSAEDCTMTPYNRQKNQEMVKLFPEIPNYGAVVMKRNVTMVLVRLFLKSVTKTGTTQLFFSRAEAIAWLQQQMVMYDNRGIMTL